MQQGNYTPIKFSSKDVRIPKPPKAPEKPLMPYMRYSRKVWEQVKNNNPQLKLWEVGKIIGQMWRELPEEDKNVIIEEYDSDKIQYAEQLRQYHSSSAYQTWLATKEREEHERKPAPRIREREAPSDFRESYILEDNEEDLDDNFTVKHIAASRFQRNHRLMQEVLSDARLPDSCHLISESRLKTLKMQVEQLKSHKRNLCQEIDSCEQKHQSKLKRIKEESSKFYEEYNKVVSSKPTISEGQFAEMIIKAKMDMTREDEERRERQLAEMEARRKRALMKQQKENEIEAEKKLNAQKAQQSEGIEEQPQAEANGRRPNHAPSNQSSSASKPANVPHHAQIAGHTQHHFPSKSSEGMSKSDPVENQPKPEKKDVDVKGPTSQQSSMPAYSSPHQMPYSHPQYSNYMASGNSPYSNIYPGAGMPPNRPMGPNVPYGGHPMTGHPSVNTQSCHPPPPPMYHPHHGGGPANHPGVMSHHHPWSHYGPPHQGMYGQVHPQAAGHQQQMQASSQGNRYPPSMNPQYGRPPAPPPYHQQHIPHNSGNPNAGTPYWSSGANNEGVPPNVPSSGNSTSAPSTISQAPSSSVTSVDTTNVSSAPSGGNSNQQQPPNLGMQNQSPHMPMPPNSMMYPPHGHHHVQNAPAGYPHMHPNPHASHPGGGGPSSMSNPYGPHGGQPYGSMPPQQQGQMHSQQNVNPNYYPHQGQPPLTQHSQHQHGSAGVNPPPHMMMPPPPHHPHQGPWSHGSGGPPMGSHYPPSGYGQHPEYSNMAPNQNGAPGNPPFMSQPSDQNTMPPRSESIQSSPSMMVANRPNPNAPNPQMPSSSAPQQPMGNPPNVVATSHASDSSANTGVSSASGVSDPCARTGAETPHGSQTPNSNSGSG